MPGTMNTKFQALCRLVLLIWICSGSADNLSAWDHNARLIVSGGGSFLPDRSIMDLASMPHPAYSKDKFQLGILAAVDLRAPLALEAGFRNEWGGYDPQSEDLSLHSRLINFTVQQFFCNAFYSTPYTGGGLRLFATGGIGLRRIHPEAGIGSDIGLSLNFGGGLEARPSRRYSLRVELRDFVADMPRLKQSQWIGGLSHDIQPSIGLVVYLK
jgi:hypothetical protein